MKTKILVAGSTGYLGRYMIKELKKQGYWIRALARNKDKLIPLHSFIDEIFIGEASKPETLTDICKDIDIVFSALGITKQKDNYTYMDVDFQSNKNLLDEAIKNNVSRFMYISVLNAQNMKNLEIIKAKEMFVDELKNSPIDHIVVRPNGFFSDMTEFFNMAQKGKVFLFGNGELKANPIHGEDLARFCVEKLDQVNIDIEIGGPEVLSQSEIAQLAFKALGKKPSIKHIPLWVPVFIKKILRVFTSVKFYGPIEFFMTVLSIDMICATYGEHKLSDYFFNLAKQNKKNSEGVVHAL